MPTPWRRFSRWAHARRRRPESGAPEWSDPRYRCPECRSWDVTADERRPRSLLATTVVFNAECNACGHRFIA